MRLVRKMLPLLLLTVLVSCQHAIPAPEIHLVSPREGEVLTADGELAFTVTAPEGSLAEVTVQVDENPVRFPSLELKTFGRFHVPLRIEELGQGEHRLVIAAVAAEDENRALATHRLSFTVELPPAELTEITLTPEKVTQGEPLTIDLTFTRPVDSVSGTLFERSFPFYSEDGIHWRALAACRLLSAPGTEHLALAVTDRAGRAGDYEREFTVVKGDFESYYIELTPSVGGRLNAETIERESAETNAVVGEFSPEQLWEPGAFIRPVEGGRVTSPFGEQRTFSTGGSESHIGTDFGGVTRGTPVVAAARGRVVMAREMIIRGNFVCIDHGRGLFIFYNHLRRILVREGEMVEAGQQIGEVGDTGVATGPHLHFEVRLASWAVDPMTFLDSAPSYR